MAKKRTKRNSLAVTSVLPSSTMLYPHGKCSSFRKGKGLENNSVSGHYRCPPGKGAGAYFGGKTGRARVTCRSGVSPIHVSGYGRNKPVPCHPRCGGRRKPGRGQRCR
jgi:hypothetical protein